MKLVKDTLISSTEYIKALGKWLAIATVVGLAGGVLGSVFHITIDYATELRVETGWLLYLLPLGGILIAAIYHLFSSKGRIDTNRVLEAVKTDGKVPLVMAPLIFVSTAITHLLGGSAGREGAALQLGGSLGYNVGKVLRLNKNDMHIIVMSGMSAVFAALFGTPLTAAIFAIEVATVGVLHYSGMVACVISSVCAYNVALKFGIGPVRFHGVFFGAPTAELVVKVILLAVLCALVSILFCQAIEKCEHLMNKTFSNRYVRALVGGAVIVVLSLSFGTRDYNGAGMDIVSRAIGGTARPEAFILKIILTAITVSAGFKGGEIVPAFFVGSTFGCVVGALLGIDAGFGAAIGFVSLFCGVVNCPVASIILGIEVFGGNGILAFGIASAISFMMSGYFGLYKSQKFVYSKLNEDYLDINAK